MHPISVLELTKNKVGGAFGTYLALIARCPLTSNDVMDRTCFPVGKLAFQIVTGGAGGGGDGDGDGPGGAGQLEVHENAALPLKWPYGAIGCERLDFK